MESKEDFVKKIKVKPYLDYVPAKPFDTPTLDELTKKYIEIEEKYWSYGETVDKYFKIIGKLEDMKIHGLAEAIIYAYIVFSGFKIDIIHGSTTGFIEWYIRDNEIDFKDLWILFNASSYIMRNTDAHNIFLRETGIDFEELTNYLLNNNPKIKEYVEAREQVHNHEEELKELSRDITFDAISKDDNTCICNRIGRHSFIKLDDQMKCAICGKSTKPYNLTPNELNLLTSCAHFKNELLLASKRDLPLIKNIVKDYTHQLDSIDAETKETYLDHISELLFLDELHYILRIHLRTAHKLDKKDYTPYKDEEYDPKYLSDEKSKKLLKGIKEDIQRASKNDNPSDSQKLYLEMCKVAKYEVLILSGEHIPTLYSKAKSKDDRIAVVKAVYNLSHIDYRNNSGYFRIDPLDFYYDSRRYKCQTADPRIHRQISRMKIYRNTKNLKEYEK